MAGAVNSCCEQHPDRFGCPDALIHYSPASGDYGIIIHDGGSSFVTIEFCPWCGYAPGKPAITTGHME